MAVKLEIATERKDPATLVYRLAGDLFGSPEAYALQEELRTQIGGGASSIVIDLSAIHRIDSSGVGIIMAVTWSASQAGGRLILAAAPASVKKVLEICMLLDHVDRADSVDEALAKLRRAEP